MCGEQRSLVRKLMDYSWTRGRCKPRMEGVRKRELEADIGSIWTGAFALTERRKRKTRSTKLGQMNSENQVVLLFTYTKPCHQNLDLLNSIIASRF